MAQPTDHQANKPVIFLAFAQDRVEGGAYLRNLPIEMDGIRKALQKARQADLCEVVERSNTTVENILDVFQEYQDRIAIFHYGGHADSYELLLESLTGEHAMAHSEGLVSFLAKQKGLQLVFLNGCCSQQQALDLIEAGLPSVVGTSQKIDDEIATNLSGRFYKGLAVGLSIDRAWAEAVDQIKVEKDTSNTRALHWKGKVETSDRFPWEIYYRPGAEIVKDWNLPEAVENPLFGLPEIPQTYDLPETPFLFLKRYERQHAEIFFGRSYHIRALYNRIGDAKSDPIILLYGQSGVGKSSLFDAGLNPRLEKKYTVIYVRRIQEKGLAGTLAFALQQKLADLDAAAVAPSPVPAPAAEPATRRQAILQLQAVAQNLDEQTVRQEIEALITKLKSNQYAVTSDQYSVSSKQEPASASRQPQPDSALPNPHSEILQQWQQLEARTGKPLLVILDQVEELYTRPNPQQPQELKVFLTALQSIFGSPAERPQGKLLLGYRKEYHPEIEAACKLFRLPRATVFLESLRKKDILDIFHGLTRTPALKARYNLTVEDELPVMLADDLLEDKDSPVAPVLQIVLTKLWKAALQENPIAPRFTVTQYEQLKKDGIAMGEFFAQQMTQLRTWQPEVVDSGLALDVLHFHTTELGTAGSRSLEELRQTYQHRQDIIDALIAKCKELYLLTEALHSAEHTGLTHDTLVPAVTKEYNSSERSGQRAARILNSKMSDFDENSSEVWLDEADLALVEKGGSGMRKLNATEEQLLELSRVKRRQRQRLRKQLWAGGVVMLLGIIATAIFAVMKMQEADSNAEKFLEQKKKADDLKYALDKEILAQAKAIAEPLARKILENSSRSSVLKLGSFDSGIPTHTLRDFIVHTQQLTGGQYWSGDKLRGDKDGEWVDFQKLTDSEMPVVKAHQFLKGAGFLPFAKIDTVCGYGTTSAIRLFQEYVRTVERDSSIGFPDGNLGPNSKAHVKRWKTGNKKAEWAGFSSAKPSPEYTKWMGLLGKVKQKYAAAPNKMLQLVNQFSQPSDTRKVAEWDFNPNKIHLIGIRRNEAKLEASVSERKFDDVFILLINGLIFKFFGSTDAGGTSNPAGMAFLVNGQHMYRLGWHRLSDPSRAYFVLKPFSTGVLLVRSKDDMALTQADLAGGLEHSSSINIHWGGRGVSRVGSWSEGAQVICGKGYVNHKGMVIDCSRCTAPNYSTLGTVVGGVYQSKGAYTILMDLITAFRNGDDNTVNYILLDERDLELDPEIGSKAAEQILREITEAN